MKYRLLKDLPLAKLGDEVEITDFNGLESMLTIKKNGKWIADIESNDVDEWLEPIVEKKTYDDLKEGDDVFRIASSGTIGCYTSYTGQCRSETFLTREEAEDEHKRREFSVRPDRFIPKLFEYKYYYPSHNGVVHNTFNEGFPWDIFCINAGLAFRTHEECEEAIASHDLIRLFYTIR